MLGRELRAVTVANLRQHNIDAAAAIDVLPLLNDDVATLHSNSQVAFRILALQCVVAVAFSPARRSVILDWANRWELTVAFTPAESQFLQGDDKFLPRFQWSVESIYALLWACGRVATCSVVDLCPNDLVARLPKISQNQSPSDFVDSTVLANFHDVPSYLDVYYVTHWLQRESAMHGKPLLLAVEPTVISYRRWAFEWLVTSDTLWDDVSLDT